MANKKNKKKAQQPAPANKAAANSKVEAKKAVAKKNEKAAKSKKNEKWPDKKELVNYSVVVCASLIVVGVVIALLDAGFGEALALFSGLRG